MSIKLSSAIHANLFARDRARITNLLNNTGMKLRTRKISAFTFILNQEISNGTTFALTEPDNAPYIILGLHNKALELPKHGRGGDELFAYLNQRYGLNEREDFTKFVFDSLRHHAFQHGERVELRRFAFFDKKTKTLYLSKYDGTAYKLDGTDVTSVKNGEGVYFADDDCGKFCESISIRDHGILLDKLTNLNFADESPGGITSEQQRKAITTWLFAIAFPDLMPTKPIILFEGPAGSGKSSCVQLIQLALMGAKKPMILQENKEDDFGIMLLRSPIAIFDNTDSFIKWIPDAICSYTTSGMWTKRKLFTDNEEIVIKPHSFIAIASKNPASFRREDVADRCVLVRLKRIEGFRRQEAFEHDIDKNRGKILGEYLHYLNLIVKEIRNGALDIPEAIETVVEVNSDENVDSDDENVDKNANQQEEDKPAAETHRMADFAAMAFVVGKVLGWTTEEVDEMLKSLQNERDVFISEEDPLVDMLHVWLERRQGPGKPKNIGRVVTCQELFSELDQLAQVDRRQFYKSARQLAHKMRSPHLESEFTIVPAKFKSHTTYQIWSKTDPRLTIVPPSNNGNNSNEGSSTQLARAMGIRIVKPEDEAPATDEE